jgi:hypothetical protein
MRMLASRSRLKWEGRGRTGTSPLEDLGWAWRAKEFPPKVVHDLHSAAHTVVECEGFFKAGSDSMHDGSWAESAGARGVCRLHADGARGGCGTSGAGDLRGRCIGGGEECEDWR